MIQDFPRWSASRSETNSLSDLSGATLGIEASFYLSDLLTRCDEPLLTALGGLPFAFQRHINVHLEFLRHNNITPIFIFHGLDVGRVHAPFRSSDEAARLVAEGWDLYSKGQGQVAVTRFGKSGSIKPEMFDRWLQSILQEKEIQFVVAPYSSAAQLAYLIRDGAEYVDAVAGSSELLLYGTEKVITSIDLVYDKEKLDQQIDFTQGTFTFVTQQGCIEELGLASQDQFVDACMLSGTSMLSSLPTLAARGRGEKVRTVVEMMKREGHTGLSVCLQLQEEDSLKREDYLDRYRRSRLAVKHQVVLTPSGKVEPFAAEQIPSDLNELIGQHLPDELYYYLSIALIGPRPLNQLTSAQIFEKAPADGGDAEAYRILVRDKLKPVRAATLALLAFQLHRVFKFRDMSLRCWFDPNAENTITIKDVEKPSKAIEQWNVHGDLLPNATKDVSLASLLSRLKEGGFAAKTVTPKTTQLLTSQLEIRANSIYRFLHIREYADDTHELTKWGQVLDVALSAGTSSTASDEAILLAIELLRYGILTSDIMFTQYTGGPNRGSPTDKRNCLLVSRVASLLRLNHEQCGYVGPLSRHLLGYTSIINVVRASLRDLLEVTLTTLLLRGEADRDALLGAGESTLTSVSLNLPFLFPSDCSLGIAMKETLDAKQVSNATNGDSTTEGKSAGVEESWFTKAQDLKGDLQKAWNLWDSVVQGVKKAVELGLVSKAVGEEWEACQEWTKARR